MFGKYPVLNYLFVYTSNTKYEVSKHGHIIYPLCALCTSTQLRFWFGYQNNRYDPFYNIFMT